MIKSFGSNVRVALGRVLSTAMLLWCITSAPTAAHEVLPAIGDMEQVGDTLQFEIRLNAESFVAGIDLTTATDTNETPQAADYDALRALESEALAAQFTQFWPQMAAQITIRMGDTDIAPALTSIIVDPVSNIELVRTSTLTFTADVPAGADTVQFGWAKEFGTLVIRQQGVDAPYDGYLEAGALTDPIALSGGGQASGWQTFVNYIPVGFDHIVPKGLDHILFVLGLFFLSTRMRPLITQISLFTLAHTITLALAALGYVSIPGSIVEPLIAASIVFVAVENIFAKGLSRWRPFVIFGFGLLHGLGFASVLGEFGLPAGSFVPALIGFNVGVEVGQLTVVAVMFLIVWQAVRIDRGENEVLQARALYGVLMLVTLALIWLNPAALATALEDAQLLFFGTVLVILVLCFVSISLRDNLEAYRRIVSIPASVAIAIVGAYWCIERVFF